MAEQGFKRKLAAILCADVEGYSRLMGDDEEATTRTLKSYHCGAVERIRPPLNLIESFETTFDAIHLKERRRL
jgi:adenylate cyclase